MKSSLRWVPGTCLVLLATIGVAGCTSADPDAAPSVARTVATPLPGVTIARPATTHKPEAIQAALDPETVPSTRATAAPVIDRADEPSGETGGSSSNDATGKPSSKPKPTVERRNGMGELWTLDEAAAAACAQAEFALIGLEAGKDPGPAMTQAVKAAKPSRFTALTQAVAGIADPASAQRQDVVTVLSACTKGGYEL